MDDNTADTMTAEKSAAYGALALCGARRVALRPARPLLLWDGDCGFCARWAARAKYWGGRRLDCQPYQQLLHELPEILAEDFDRLIHLILPDGQVLTGAAAVYRVAALRWPLRWVNWLYRKLPCFARLSEAIYRRVAARRKCRVGGGDNSGSDSSGR